MARFLEIKLEEVIINDKSVVDNLYRTVEIIEDGSWTQVASGVSCLMLAEAIHDYKVVFSGSGSDEIFASYPNQRRWQWKDDQYDDARRNLIGNIHKTNVIRENKCFMNSSIEIRLPFLDIDFIDYALNIDWKKAE